LPCVDPDAEGKDVVDPFFQVAFIFVFTGDGFVLREAVCPRWQSVGLGV